MYIEEIRIVCFTIWMIVFTLSVCKLNENRQDIEAGIKIAELTGKKPEGWNK